MAIDEDRIQRLRNEGIIVGPLTRAQEAVLDGLTPDEEDVMIAVGRRLFEADRVSRIENPEEDVGFWTAIHF